jgi:hypothetical protein
MAPRFDPETLRRTLASTIGHWMAATGVDHEAAVWHLRRLASELQRRGPLHHAWRVRCLDAARDLDDDGPEAA